MSLLSIETPRSEILQCMVYVAVMGLHLFDIDIASHSSGLNFIFHLVPIVRGCTDLLGGVKRLHYCVWFG